MKSKLRPLILVGSFFFLLVIIFSYTYIKRHNDLKEANLVYQDALKPKGGKDNPFLVDAQLAFYDSLNALPRASPVQKKTLGFFRGFTLLKCGREKEAVDVLEPLVEEGESSQYDGIFTTSQKMLALAWLRLGEKNNCINNHSSGSCIFPIRGQGVYSDPSASGKAIHLYEEVLRKSPNDLESRWLLNIAYMTVGTYPRLVPKEWLIPGLDKDSADVRIKAFKDVSAELGINSFRSEAGGAIVDDFNNDGNLDVVLSSWDLEQPMHYFKSNGDGTFTDASQSSGIGAIKGGLNIIQADYNNDGFTDILVLRGAWMQEYGNQPKSLLRNNGDGTFTDVTVESGLLSLGPTQTATWADFNNDGWLDLFIGHESLPNQPAHPSQLFVNNHDGTFTDVAEKAGCQAVLFMKGVTSSDYDKDGWPDIFVSGRDGRKILYHNKAIKGSAIPQFEDVTHAAGLDLQPTYTFPTWFFDYDNDGWPDLFVSGYGFGKSMATALAMESLGAALPPDVGHLYLYHNNHDGTFTEVAKQMGLDHAVFSMGANFGDIDNDGWLDMYLATGNPDFTSLVPNRMFHNNGGKSFTEVTSSARVGNLQKGHGVSFADIDNDGDQDVFVEVGGAYKGDGYFNSLYENPGQNDNRWISVLLKGSQSNRSAIGAHITAIFKEVGVERKVYMDVSSGGSFGANPLRKEIGIGQATSIDSLVIQWPTSGITQVFTNVAPCQFLTIKEGVDKPGKMDLKKMTLHGKPGAYGMGMGMEMLDCAPGTKKN
jgi:hypothetical protein